MDMKQCRKFSGNNESFMIIDRKQTVQLACYFQLERTDLRLYCNFVYKLAYLCPVTLYMQTRIDKLFYVQQEGAEARLHSYLIKRIS